MSHDTSIEKFKSAYINPPFRGKKNSMRFKIGKLYHIISFRFILLQFDVSHDISIEKVQKKLILVLLTPHVKYPFKFPHGVLIWKATTTYPSGHVYQVSASYDYSFMPKSV